MLFLFSDQNAALLQFINRNGINGYTIPTSNNQQQTGAFIIGPYLQHNTQTGNFTQQQNVQQQQQQQANKPNDMKVQ